MKILRTSAVMAMAALLATGCASKECRLDDPDACGSDLACEAVEGREEGQGMCFEPVQVEGFVYDLQSEARLADAQVSALDLNGSPLGTVAVSDGDGQYVLRIPTRRLDEQGTPKGQTITLRASAQDHAPFPGGIRPALPIDLGTAQRQEEGRPWTVGGELAQVGLFALPQDERGHARIEGKVEGAADGTGALVVASTSSGTGTTAYSAIADRFGAFVLFNVRPGSYAVRGYARGVNYTPVTAEVATGTNATDVKLVPSGVPTAAVSGSVQIVSASGATSVVLVVEETFNEALVRGEVPPGLRAPSTGVPSITGDFSIEGVPDGRYAVLAAFEDDGLVRDPNPNTAGTTIQRLVVESGAVQTTLQGFKVTDAVSLVSPGPTGAIDVAPAIPIFQWTPYPSAKAYDLEVFDATGRTVWSATAVTLLSSDDPVSATYGGDALAPGRIYQWRVFAIGQAGNRLSQSEDLEGIFRVE